MENKPIKNIGLDITSDGEVEVINLITSNLSLYKNKIEYEVAFTYKKAENSSVELFPGKEYRKYEHRTIYPPILDIVIVRNDNDRYAVVINDYFICDFPKISDAKKLKYEVLEHIEKYNLIKWHG